jgi:hypothetical protein
MRKISQVICQYVLLFVVCGVLVYFVLLYFDYYNDKVMLVF